jgi:hypothetical protein
MLDTQNQGPQCTACGSPMKLTAIEPSHPGQDFPAKTSRPRLPGQDFPAKTSRPRLPGQDFPAKTCEPLPARIAEGFSGILSKAP